MGDNPTPEDTRPSGVGIIRLDGTVRWLPRNHPAVDAYVVMARLRGEPIEFDENEGWRLAKGPYVKL